MLNEGIDLAQQADTTEQPKKVHPYTPNTEPEFKCDPGDKECTARWVQAFGDCA